MPQNNKTFEAQCTKCFGLCCTALSFERGKQFAHDKPAGQPCQFLEDNFRCAIHARREQLGYDGCEAFDCLGAGQRASALFAPLNWQRDPAVARRLYASFSQLLRIQEMRQALETAAELGISDPLHAERIALLEALSEDAESGREEAIQAAGDTLKDCRAFLKRLAPSLVREAD